MIKIQQINDMAIKNRLESTLPSLLCHARLDTLTDNTKVRLLNDMAIHICLLFCTVACPIACTVLKYLLIVHFLGPFTGKTCFSGVKCVFLTTFGEK